MKNLLTHEVLGAKIMVSKQKSFEWTTARGDKILSDLQAIKALPCANRIAQRLVAAKILPLVSFAPFPLAIPKTYLRTLQNSIAAALWGNRPIEVKDVAHCCAA